MKSLESLGHDPTSRIQALEKAQSYGTELLTGVFFGDPTPPPTLGELVRQRHETLMPGAPPRERILDLFLYHEGDRDDSDQGYGLRFDDVEGRLRPGGADRGRSL